MKLAETIEMMVSSDYKERFKAEYAQLKIRVEGLGNMVEKYKNGELLFKPTCSCDLLEYQLENMEEYMFALKERARAENIDLSEFDK